MSVDEATGYVAMGCVIVLVACVVLQIVAAAVLFASWIVYRVFG